MSEQEAFDKWFDKQLDIGYAFTSDEQITRWAWQASAKLSDKEKQEQSAEIAQLKATINDLREALERINASKTARYEVEADVGGEVFDVLEKTPEQSLQSVINETIEKCAKVCEEIVIENPGRADLTADHCAKTIRELKVSND